MPFNVHGDGLMIFLLRPINMMNYINRYLPFYYEIFQTNTKDERILHCEQAYIYHLHSSINMLLYVLYYIISNNF